MPAEFAATKGRTYPAGVLPENMPLPIAGKMTKVPDLSACTSWGQCNELITRAGLVAQQVIAHIDPSVFKVLSVSPPANTDVTEGSVITITTQPAKIDPRLVFKMRDIPALRISAGYH